MGPVTNDSMNDLHLSPIPFNFKYFVSPLLGKLRLLGGQKP